MRLTHPAPPSQPPDQGTLGVAGTGARDGRVNANGTCASAAVAEAPAAEPAFGVYVHWPFCLSKCPYCDFNSHVRARIDHGRWRRALLAELDHYAGLLPGRRVASVFFGGGTPSLMEPDTVAAVLERIAARWHMCDAAEITLEANPTSVEAAKFAALAETGVNRLSLGVQALNDADLKFLGRGHSAVEAIAAVELARRHFPRFSFDLIYARPGQTRAAWRRELAQALALAASHLSLYQLTLEEGTPFHRAARRGRLRLPDEALQADLFDLTQEMTAAAGLPAYEISNHARPGAESRHNLIYWRYGEYAGIGPGAHGRILLDGGRRATAQHRRPEAWLAAVESEGHATAADDVVPADERAAEMLMMGLRLAEGVALDRLAAETGRDLTAWVAMDRVDQLAADGYLRLADRRLQATDAGRRVLNAVLSRLLA